MLRLRTYISLISPGNQMINPDGILETPLYHGTSDLYLDSIKRYGLGGRLPYDKHEIQRLIQLLCDKYENQFPDSDWWMMNGPGLRAMYLEPPPLSFNFRYGSVYLTPSRFTAINYALANKYGSELLSNLFAGFNELEALSVAAADEVIPQTHSIRGLLELEPNPIIIIVDGVEASILRTEQGEDIGIQLDFMEDFRKSMPDHCDTTWQQFNFELLDVIAPESLRFEYV